jgi:hypothetical protein
MDRALPNAALLPAAFGADTVGNPLAAKFVEIAKKNGLNPEGMNIVDDEGEKGTFGNNTFNWDQFANDATGMNESINESYILELKRVLKNSGQLLNEAGGIGGGISGGKFGTKTASVMPSTPTPPPPKLPGWLTSPDKWEKDPTVHPWNGIKGTDDMVQRYKLKPQPGGARPEGPAAGMPAAPKVFDPQRGGKPQGNTARTTPTPLPVGKPKNYPVPVDTTPGGKPAVGPAYNPGLTGKVQRSTTVNLGGARPEGPAAGMPRATPGGARPEGPAAAMPKAPPQPASFKDAFRAARKAAGGAGGVFMWNGKPYQTNIKGEKGLAWNSKDLKQVGNWSASESADANGIAVNEAVAKIACTKCDEVSTAAAWNKNHDTCPKCKKSKQGVAEAATPINKSFEVHYTTSTGTNRVIKVNAASKKAAQDKVAGRKDFGSLHKIVEPKKTNEAAKPDFLDMDKDGNKKEPMKKAVADKKKGAVKEAAKPDFLDMDKDGNKKEPMKKALKDKEKVSESISYLKRLAGL